MGTLALDANVLIGFLDPSDALHPRALEAMRPWLGPDHRRIVAMTVYSDVLVHPFRHGSPEAMDEFLAETSIELLPVDRPLARLAAELRAREERLDLGDAMVLAAAMRTEAQLLTFDEGLGQLAVQLRR